MYLKIFKLLLTRNCETHATRHAHDRQICWYGNTLMSLTYTVLCIPAKRAVKRQSTIPSDCWKVGSLFSFEMVSKTVMRLTNMQVFERLTCISMVSRQFCLPFLFSRRQILCNVLNLLYSRRDTSLEKWENRAKAGVEAEEAVEVLQERVERKVGRSRVHHHPLKQSEMWICWVLTPCRTGTTSLIMRRSFCNSEGSVGTQERKERRRKKGKGKKKK